MNFRKHLLITRFIQRASDNRSKVKMKWFHLASLLLLGVLWCRADENDLQDITKDADSDEDFYGSVKELFEKKCRQVGGDEAVQNLTRVVEGLKLCLGDQLPKNADELKNLKNDSSSSEELCSENQGKIRECFNDFIDVWKECSEPEEKYVPDFVFGALEAVLEFFCADDGAVILKVLNEETINCVESLEEKENVTDVCADQFKFLKEDAPEDITITKAELCEDLETAKTCYGAYIEELCPKATDLREVVVGFLDAVKSPCKPRNKRNPLGLKLPY